MKTTAKRLLGALGAIAALAGPVAAQSVDDAIDARRAYMTLISYKAGPLFAMAKGDVAYDPALASTLADDLLAITALDGLAMFPEGSDNVAKAGDTRALPAVWENFDDYTVEFTAFEAAVENLAANAGTDQAALQQAVAEFGGTCRSCHSDYRARDF